MNVIFKDNKGACMYRGVAFVGENPSEVTPEWFEAATNPRIVEAKQKAKAKAADNGD